MDNKNEVREFLTSRRARLTPEKAGILGGGNRRVAGLRRGEVAALAGLENGNDPSTTTRWLDHVTDDEYTAAAGWKE